MFVQDKVSITHIPDLPVPKPKFGIVIYGTQSGEHTATMHQFQGEMMQAGEIINIQEVTGALLNIDCDTNKSVSFIPQNLLFEDHRLLVWHTAARKTEMWFRLNLTKPFSLNVEWTPLVFILDKRTRTLSVLALESSERPTEDSMTYFAPLANIYQEHSLCQGSAVLPLDLSANSLVEIENTLYDSAFDGFKRTNALAENSSEQDQLEFWKTKKRLGESVDVKKELRPFKKLTDVLSSYNQ